MEEALVRDAKGEEEKESEERSKRGIIGADGGMEETMRRWGDYQ